MKRFKPFAGYTYYNRYEKSNNFSKYVCPYNFENLTEEKINSLKKNENNVYLFVEDLNGKANFKTLLDENVFVAEKSEVFYVYEMSYKINNTPYKITGVVGVLKLPEKGEDYLKICEEVDEKDVLKNIDFLKNCEFFSSPICAIYEEKEEEKIYNLIENLKTSSCFLKAKYEKVIHKIWKVKEEEKINILIDFFKDKEYYVVGGTEKCEAILKSEDFFDGKKPKYVAAFLFSSFSNRFVGLPVHRLVSELYMFDSKAILEKSLKYFEISHCKNLDVMRNLMFNFRRQNRVCFGFYADDCFNVLTLKSSNEVEKMLEDGDISKNLDVFVLNEILLKNVLNIKSSDVKYSHNDLEAVFCVDSANACFAIFLNAIRSSEFFKIVKENKKLPKKSFCFFPRPVEGLFFQLISEK